MLTLRPYQHEAVTACLAAHAEGKQRLLVSLPTGTGKTIIFASLLQQRGGRALVLAHRDELIEQAVEKLHLVDDALDIGIVKAEQDAHQARTVIASVQTLSRVDRLTRVTPDFHTLIVDEAHHAVADSYLRILEYCGAWDDTGPLVVGVTATPERGDRESLGQIFQQIVYQQSLLTMMQAGYLCDLKAVQVLLDANFDTVRTQHGDFVDSDMAGVLLRANAPALVLEAYQAHAEGRKTLCFTPTVATAHAMADVFCEAGIATEALDGTTPRDTRHAILHRLRTGETQVVCNCAVLTEGFDEPSLACIIVARPTQSRPFYQQMIGRGTRTYPGKHDCLILDVVGVSTQHQLQTVSTLFEVDSAALARGTVLSAVAEREAREPEAEQATRDRAARGVIERPTGHLVSSMVNLFERRALAWMKTGQGTWMLAMSRADGAVRLVQEGPDAWQVIHQRPDAVPVMVQRGLPLGYAQGVAEDLARELGAGGLLNTKARWRQQPMTDKQRATLAKLRIACDPAITQGEASALITAFFADRPRRVTAIRR